MDDICPSDGLAPSPAPVEVAGRWASTSAYGPSFPPTGSLPSAALRSIHSPIPQLRRLHRYYDDIRLPAALLAQRSGLPLRCATALTPAVATGSPLFPTYPLQLDSSPCPRKVRRSMAGGPTMLPARSGKAIGTFDVNGFGVQPHTSLEFLSTLRTPRYRKSTQDSVTSAMPLTFWASLLAGLDRCSFESARPHIS